MTFMWAWICTDNMWASRLHAKGRQCYLSQNIGPVVAGSGMQRVGNAISVKTLVRWLPGLPDLPDLLRCPCYNWWGGKMVWGLFLHVHTVAAGLGFHLPFDAQTAVILPAGTSPELHLKNATAPSVVLWYESIESFLGLVGSPQLTGGESDVIWSEQSRRTFRGLRLFTVCDSGFLCILIFFIEYESMEKLPGSSCDSNQTWIIRSYMLLPLSHLEPWQRRGKQVT